MEDNKALELQPDNRLAQFSEQNVSMMQQLATAQIQSRYQIAVRFPRDIERVRQEMLRECSRPSFCTPDESKNGSSIAIYRVPRAKTNIEGVTIRFAEMAARSYRNLGIEVQGIGEDQSFKRYQVTCTDYESNLFFTEMVDVPKSIERSYAKDTDTVLSTRTNSFGKPVYTIIGTDDDLAMKRNALISKATRNLIMKHLPGWLVEECIEKVKQTAQAKDAADPDAAKRKLYDAFAGLGVSALHLSEYLGHNNALSPAELEDLRGYYSGIREGVTSWREIVAAKEENGAGTEDVEKKIEALFESLEIPPAQARKTKAKYIGNAPKLIEYLEAQLAKKQNDGSKQEDKKTDPAKEEDTSANGAIKTTEASRSANTSTKIHEEQKTARTDNPDSEPEEEPESKPDPVRQDTKKAAPPVIDVGGWE